MAGKYLGRRHEYCRLFCRKLTSFPTCMYKSLTNYVVCNIRMQQVKGVVRYVHQRLLSEQGSVRWEQCCNVTRIHLILIFVLVWQFLSEWINVVNCTNAWNFMNLMPNLALRLVEVQGWPLRCLLLTSGSRMCIAEISHQFYDWVCTCGFCRSPLPTEQFLYYLGLVAPIFHECRVAVWKSA